MPEISLKDYLAKLDSALFAGSADEVIHHCRHILQFYPKNVAAYRYLGRALIYNARYDEASAALRRVLSVIPDDYTAHLSLSDAYDGLKRGDQAIWHLERAFEQQPNNRELIEGVRSLYRRYRSIEPKIQLTGAAVARQHLANSRYAQAVETLRGSVARTPDRVDLKLLLAQTLWKQGDEVGGAEAALDVLEILPDCLEANVLLTKLWLGQNRPSDAQRYLNRVESIDPYRALELAQGDAPDDAFRLEELDYQRFAKTEAVSARPDWLTAVSGDSPAATSNEDVNAEWTRWQSGMLASPEAAQPAASPKPASQTYDFNFDDSSEDESSASTLKTPPPDEDVNPVEWMQAAGVEIYEVEQDVPLFDDDFDVNIEAESPTAWMDDRDEVVTADRVVPTQQDEDPMAWLRDEMPDAINDSAPPITVTVPDDEDEAGFNFEFDFAADSDSTSREDRGAEVAQPSEALDWLDSSSPDAIDLFADEAPQALPEEEAPIEAVPDWLQSAAPQTGFDQPEAADQDAAAVASFDLFGDIADRSDALTPSTPEPPSSVPGARKGLTAMLNNANLDWLPKAQPEPEPAEDAWMSMFAEPKTADPVNDTPDWLSALDETAQPADLGSEPSMPDDAGSAFAFDTPPETESIPTSVEFDLPSDADFDWLTGDSGEEDDGRERPVEDTSEIGTLSSGYSTAAPTQPAPTGETPDWLSEMRPDDYEPEAERVSMGNESEQKDDALSDELPDWLFEVTPETPAEPQPDQSNTGGFDWTAVEPDDDAETAAQQTTQMPNWLDALAGSSIGEEPEIPTPTESASTGNDAPAPGSPLDTGSMLTEIPDWLTSLQPEPEPEPEDEPSFDEFATLFADPHVPDSSVEITESMLPVGMGAVEHEPVSAQPDELPLPSDEDFSWLTEAGEASGHEGDQGQDFGALEGEPDELFATDSEWVGDDLAAAVGDQSSVTPMGSELPSEGIPDWLSELQPVEAEPEPEPEATLFADPHVPDSSVEITESMLPVGMGAVEHEPAPPAEEDFSWLTEAGEASGHEGDQGQDFGALEGKPDELFAAQSEWVGDDLAAAVGDQSSVTPMGSELPPEGIPDWLSELQPVEPEPEPAPEPEAKPEPSFDEFATLFADPHVPDSSVAITESMLPVGMGAVEHEPAPPAEEDFSWLTEAGATTGHEGDQGQDFGALEGEPDELFATDSEWVGDDLAAAVGDQSSVTPMGSELPSEGIPDWLSELQPVEPEPEPEPEADEFATLFADPHVPDSSVEITESMLPVGMGAVEDEPAPPAEEDFSWLTEAGEASGHEGDQGQDFGALEGKPDELFATQSEWVGDDLAAAVGDQSSIVGQFDGDQSTQAETFDEDETFGEAVPAHEFPAWLTDMQPDESPEQPAHDESAFEVESAVSAAASDEEEFDWLSEAGDLLEPTPEQPYLPEVTDEQAAAPVEEVTMPTEPVRPEELAHEAASNVPDWLNAIIPGIDIDVEEGEAPIESDFVEEPGVLEHETLYAAANESDFDWLVDIVDEETRETLPEAPPELPETLGVTPASAPRFAFTRRPEWLKFSKAPAWLKSSSQPTAPSPADPTGTPSTQDDFPDWPEDDPDDINELPDWLK